MKNTQFEQLLKNKALSYKPMVSPGVIANAKAMAAAGKTGLVKTAIVKISSSVAAKSLIGVVTVTTAGYITVDQIQKHEQVIVVEAEKGIEEAKKESTADFKKELALQTEMIESQSTVSLAADEGISADALMAANHSNAAQKDESALSKLAITNSNTNVQNNVKDSPIIESPLITTQSSDAVKSHVYLNGKSFCSFNHKVYSPGLDWGYGEGANSIEKQSKEKSKQRRFLPSAVHPYVSVGNSYLIRDKVNSNQLDEKRQGKQLGAGLILFYPIKNKWQLILDGGYSEYQITSDYTANNQSDGKIKREMALISIKTGIQYDLLTMKHWRSSLKAAAGVAYKLSHSNQINGKFFEESFTTDLTGTDQLSPAANLALSINYQLDKRICLGMDLLANGILFNSNTQLLNTSARMGIIYKW